MRIVRFCWVLAVLCSSVALGADIYDVKNLGAVGDGKTKETALLQKIIDQCAAEGGGVVLLPRGTYLTGTLHLKSKVTLHLSANATLLGSTDPADYPPNDSPIPHPVNLEYARAALVVAYDATDVGLRGAGTIDGRGGAEVFTKGRKGMDDFASVLSRPFVLSFVRCQNVHVQGVTLKDPAAWTQVYQDCDDVYVNGITVRARVNGNNDGIDIDGCRNVRISDGDFRSGDDAICLKSQYKTCENIVVSNCLISSHCSAIKFGTASNGGFKNIAISNCSIYENGLSGISLEIVDGGAMENVAISNITMNDVGCPIFIKLGNAARARQQGQPAPAIGTLSHVSISNITATITDHGAKGRNPLPAHITGLPGHPVNDVMLSNINITYTLAGRPELAKIALDKLAAIAEKEKSYPEYNMFHELPAWGLYCRHVAGLSLSNVTLRSSAGEFRPALICDDVTDLDINGFKPQSATPAPVVLLNGVHGALLRGCIAPAGSKAFLRVQQQTDGVHLAGNDLSRAGKEVESEAAR